MAAIWRRLVNQWLLTPKQWDSHSMHSSAAMSNRSCLADIWAVQTTNLSKCQSSHSHPADAARSTRPKQILVVVLDIHWKWTGEWVSLQLRD